MEHHPEFAALRPPARAPGDPTHAFDVATLRQFVGAPVPIGILESAADRAVQCGRVLEDTLIVGPPGSGKAVVARALARDAAQRTIEVDAAWLRSGKHVVRAMRALEDRDVLLVRRIDELRPASMRMLASMMVARGLARELDRGPTLADCTVIATAETLPRHGACLRRIFALGVELPVPSHEALVAAGFRAALAHGAAATPEVRAAIERRVSAAIAGGWTRGAARSSGSSSATASAVVRGGGGGVNVEAIARLVAGVG